MRLPTASWTRSAAYRRSKGMAAVSINCRGPWSDIGFASGQIRVSTWRDGDRLL